MNCLLASQPVGLPMDFSFTEQNLSSGFFDRSGPYSSGEFDIHEEPERFILSLAGYAFMSDQELGLDTSIECTGTKRTITLAEDVSGTTRKLQLDQKPFVKQQTVVCRGTTCFRTTDYLNVVRFSWTTDTRPSEADHLRLAHERASRASPNYWDTRAPRASPTSAAVLPLVVGG